MQNITISGNLTSDATALQGQNGSENMSFRVAVNDTRKGEKTVTFYDVFALRTGVFNYLRKGQGVVVNGRLSISTADRDGKTYTNIDVMAREIELTGGPKQS